GSVRPDETLGDEALEIGAQGVPFGTAEHSLGGGVEGLDRAAVVDDENRVRGRLKNRCQTPAVFEQLLFELSNRHGYSEGVATPRQAAENAWLTKPCSAHTS